MRKSDMQRREPAHRQAHDMGTVDPEMVENGSDVIARTRLRIAFRICGHIGRGITAGVERNAAVAAREEPHLRLPAAMVAGKLVDEDDRRADAGFLVVELHAIIGGGVGHSGLRHPARQS